jgi:heat shock protein HslJ
MSGMPYPQRVRVEIEGEQLLGCGGDPARLLQGGEWVVEDILGGGIIDRSRVTLRFWQDGRLTGRASCNNLMGQYQLSGEGLAIGQAATTRMACSPALMEQEQRVLNSLAQVQRFDIDDTGALLLYTSEGALKARLEH